MKPPAFQFYAADFLVGTATMTAEEVGAYIRLLCYQWDTGSVPDDDATICRLGGCGGIAVARLRQKFRTTPDGLKNPRMELEREKQRVYREKQAENGAKRWGGNAKPQGLAHPTHVPNGCSPSPSPSPSPSLIPLPPKQAALPRREAATVIPLLLSTDEFAAAWTDWLAHRREIKHPIAPGSQTERGQLKQLESWGEARAIAAIRHTIFKGWQGLKEPDERDQRAAAGAIGKRSSMAS